MRFGPVATREALGSLLAHSMTLESRRLKKGHLLTAEDLTALEAAGHERVIVAALSPQDVGEDAAAEALAARVAGHGTEWRPAATGRANLFATELGVLTIRHDLVDRMNAVDEAITFATLPAFSVVPPGTMVATVKIIPFGAPAQAVAEVEKLLDRPLVSVAPFRPKRVRLIQTMLPGTSPKMLDKTARITANRVAAVSGTLLGEQRCAHAVEPLAAAIAEANTAGFDMLLIAGASAITDRADILPAAIVRAGGRLRRFGMPVDPGNLLLLAGLDDRPVLGLPGCARSPRANGFDWVLERLAADLDITSEQIAGMGVGGLLQEIPSRPQPREPQAPARPGSRADIAAIVLAAGRSTRMGARNKLTQPVAGRPMVHHAVEAARSSAAGSVLVVTGHEADDVRTALDGLEPTFVHNPGFADGLAGSLKAGLAALPATVQGVIVLLGDMPRVGAAMLDRLVQAFDPDEEASIVVPVHAGRRGNPVLIGRRHFAELAVIEGDKGARDLIAAHPENVVEVPMEDDAALLDIDTPDALAAFARAEPA